MIIFKEIFRRNVFIPGESTYMESFAPAMPGCRTEHAGSRLAGMA